MRRKMSVFAMALGLAVVVGAAAPALAGIAQVMPASHVTDSVTDNGNGTFTYEYTVFNDSLFGGPAISAFVEEVVGDPVIVDWELPWFDDAGIDPDSILSATNWDWAIETVGVVNPLTGWGGVAAWQTPGDPLYQGTDSPFTTATQVLHWYSTAWALNNFDLTDGIFPFSNNPLSGFGFIAAFDQTGAPYQASWAFSPVQTGDPAFPLGGVPGSPQALGTPIPEPGTLLLLGSGLAGLGALRRRRKTREPQD